MASDAAQVGEAYGDRLRAAFDEVMDVKPEDRRAFVESRFAADLDIRKDLLGMLEHVDTDTTFIEPPDPEALKAALDWTSTDPKSSGPRLRALAGTTVAGRYVLTRLLGSGGAGVVYEAKDQIADTLVAVKILLGDAGEGRLDQRWEATTLRLLRLPGVIQLLDEGESEGLVYLVTDLVKGEPFPGRPASRSWRDLEDTALALLETLDRMHGAGIVHRDLKPGNVLVDARGRPHVLDLGIAQGQDAVTTQASRSARRGTLGYMAPEQLRGEPATARSDIYAVGVMLHEALSGARYRSEPSVRLARFGLISERPKSLETLEGEIPERVRRVLQSMLEPDPLKRPASVRDVLDALLEGDTDRPNRLVLAFLGRGDRSTGDSTPFTEEDLRRLFAGPDRLLHLQEDGARELWARTRGEPRAVARELDAWSRAGLGWWHPPHYHVRRRDLDVLARGVRMASASPAAKGETPPLDEVAEELALVVELAAPRATLDLVAQVLERTTEEVAAQVEELEASGWIRRTEEDTLELVSPSDPTGAHQARRPEIHRRIALALEPGDERRLFHWVAAGRVEPVPAESIAVASALLEAGKVDQARAIVREGLRALTRRPDAAWQIQLLELDLLAAIRGSTTRALDEVLRDLGAIPPSIRVERLERIARGAMRAMGGEPQRVLDEVPVPDATVSKIEARAALSVRTFAGRALGSAVLQGVLGEAEAFVGTSAPIRMLVQVERAWLAYREGRFADAAAGHLAAADVASHAVGRNGCLVNAASAFLEAGVLERAEALAEEALGFARERRLVHQEIRAEWLARSAAYRRGHSLRPDVRLALASSQAGMPRSAGPIHLNEAAIAWRLGRRRTTERLARSAARAMTGTPGRWARLLANALALASSEAPDEAEAAEVLAECRACPSARVAIQAAGLLARTPTRAGREAKEIALSRSPEIPASEQDLRREILSAAEAVKSTHANA